MNGQSCDIGALHPNVGKAVETQKQKLTSIGHLDFRT